MDCNMAIHYFDFTKWRRPAQSRTKDKSSSAFSICHWNLSSITAHSYAKVSLLEAYIIAQKFDIVCISKKYLDSSTAYDDGYNLIGSDHPSNKKRGAVCIYYKNSLPLRVLSIHYLQECINFELKIGNKLLFLCVGLRVSPRMNLKNFLKIWKGI